jgi:hypothetical protein
MVSHYQVKCYLQHHVDTNQEFSDLLKILNKKYPNNQEITRAALQEFLNEQDNQKGKYSPIKKKYQ